MLKLILLAVAVTLAYRYWKSWNRRQQLQQRRPGAVPKQGKREGRRNIVEADFKDLED